MIVVTGAAGFIGSCLVKRLNNERFMDVVAVDDFSKTEKDRNLEGASLAAKVERKDFFNWLDENQERVQFIFHLGARTDTTEFDWDIFQELNLSYSQQVWKACVKYSLPLVYASSAATYGDGEMGYSDNHKVIDKLKPLNPYGKSKHDFDLWALEQKETPYFWVGLKFFNVYGPNEYHKGRMASVIFHAFNQIKETGEMKLFRSHKDEYENGKQLRDFIYVDDLVNVLYFWMHNRKNELSGIYNLGTGKAQSFLELVETVFKGLDKEPNIEFIDIPEDIRDTYQYFTEADMTKLLNAGYKGGFKTLQEGALDYVKSYLIPGKYY